MRATSGLIGALLMVAAVGCSNQDQEVNDLRQQVSALNTQVQQLGDTNAQQGTRLHHLAARIASAEACARSTLASAQQLASVRYAMSSGKILTVATIGEHPFRNVVDRLQLRHPLPHAPSLFPCARHVPSASSN